ncbi:MAG: S-layer protein domain-containing protein, partial [Victivallales bacterium]
RVLTDADDKKSLYTGSSLLLEEDYSLSVIEVDLNGDTVWVRLEKDGKVVDNAFLSSNEDYVYETELGGAEDVPVIIVHFSQIFRGVETNAVFVEGVFQISDNYIEIENGDEFGELEVSSISRSGIEMENKDSISLSRDKTIDIMGKLKIRVADADELRFAPEVDMAEPGTYELRGTVYDERFKTLEWTPFNFEGFYYDLDENVSTESLLIEELDGKTIEDGKLVYTTRPKPVEFEKSEWGSYEVIGFLAKKYFAGYPEGAFGSSKEVNVLSDSLLSRVLIDEDDKKALYTGSSLFLEEGYSLKAAQIDVNGDKVLMELYGNGKLLDTEALASDSDYIYEIDVNGAEDVPLIVVHVSEIFRSAELDAVFLEGVFQVSDEFLEIDTGDSFREMEVSSVSGNGIVLENEDSISLSRDDTIELMGDISFRVADSNVLRFYPFVEVESEAKGAQLEIDLPDTLVLGQPVDIRITARGAAVGGAEVLIEEKSLGTTPDSGNLSYTPEKTGSFTVHAKKEGYTSASRDFDVIREGARKLYIEISPDPAFEGDTLSIRVSDSIPGDPVEGAEVFFGGQKLEKKTAEDGTVSYRPLAPGIYMVNATFPGFEKGEASIEVKALAAEFIFSELLIEPDPVEAGKPAKISVNVENTGNLAGEDEVELRINGSIKATGTVKLEPGTATVLEFEHVEEEAGTYLVELGYLSKSYTVSKKAPFVSGFAALCLFFVAVLLLKKGRKR